MKQTVTDIQDIRATLDEEDEQLMRMFPRRREAALNEMLLVQKDGEMYLLRKADVARANKVLRGIVLTLLACMCVLYLTLSVLFVLTGRANVWTYLILGELCLAPFLIRLPKEVKGGC